MKKRILSTVIDELNDASTDTESEPIDNKNHAKKYTQTHQNSHRSSDSTRYDKDTTQSDNKYRKKKGLSSYDIYCLIVSCLCHNE